MMEAAGHRASLRLLSRSFHAFALKPEPPISDWLKELDSWLEKTPDFFEGKAIVLDLTDLPIARAELFRLVVELNRRNIRVLGVDSRDPDHGEDGLPILESKVVKEKIKNEDSQADAGAEPSGKEFSPTTVIIDRPVRSGQSIVNNDGDVIVIGSVASAAEIMAVGSIHIYGTLRGRAMAGVLGYRDARIFCHKMEAELIAIDGTYLLAEHMDEAYRGKAIQAKLEDTTLRIALQD